jgi:hypothetical protein
MKSKKGEQECGRQKYIPLTVDSDPLVRMQPLAELYAPSFETTGR